MHVHNIFNPRDTEVIIICTSIILVQLKRGDGLHHHFNRMFLKLDILTLSCG